MTTRPNTPHRIIQLGLVDVAQMNLLDYFRRDQWDSFESASAGEFINLIGDEILSVSEKHQRDPLEILRAAQDAVAMLRAAITGEEVTEMQGQQVRKGQRQIPEPVLTAEEILPRIPGTPA